MDAEWERPSQLGTRVNDMAGEQAVHALTRNSMLQHGNIQVPLMFESSNKGIQDRNCV